MARDNSRPARLPAPRTRSFTIIAQDPATVLNGRIVLASVDVPAEALAAGPWGHRVQVIDYDVSTDTLYAPLDAARNRTARQRYRDPFKGKPDARLLADPHFHAQNVYAIAMRTLARFERALGRRVSWGFRGHQLKVAPHAFADANAFYAEGDEALMFGYFPADDGGMVFTCLSHDVVAHETTHALVDGIRTRFTDPSSADQAGFHEGFADIVALLSIFSLQDVINAAIELHAQARAAGAGRRRRQQRGDDAFFGRDDLTPDSLRDTALFTMADQMGQELSHVRGQPLRASAQLKPSKRYYRDDPEFAEAHRRGEILVAAVMNAFLEVWSARLAGHLAAAPRIHRTVVAEEGSRAADYLLTMCIRALDYTPPVHLQFGDFLSAVLTADSEIRPDDSQYGFRAHLLASFRAYGIEPASPGTREAPGCWRAEDASGLELTRTHFEPMQRDPDEVFWFVWENRAALKVDEGAYGHVISVRPCLRVAPDGFPLRETVAEFVQVVTLTPDELRAAGIRIPQGFDGETVTLRGGNTLVFDEYGRLKFNIHNRILDRESQSARLRYLWEEGYLDPGASSERGFAALHLRRAAGTQAADRAEVW
jgi:hypothetical protein